DLSPVFNASARKGDAAVRRSFRQPRFGQIECRRGTQPLSIAWVDRVLGRNSIVKSTSSTSISRPSNQILVLQGEILKVIPKHVALDCDEVQIKLDRGDPISTLEIDVKVPSLMRAAALVGRTGRPRRRHSEESSPPAMARTATT